jgi:protein TonB
MFDLVTGDVRHLPRHQGAPIVISTSVQLLVGTLVLAIPYLYVTNQIPEVPTMMAFVAAAPAPPPPPPPPAPAPKAEVKPAVRPDPSKFTAPIEPPTEVVPEPVTAVGTDIGVPGGVEGGVPGGVVGGIVGGIPEAVPPPPPPPPPPVQRGPVRVGGQIKMPALLHRVEPEYPALALSAQIEGLVILEAIVDERGQVEEVKVLRSAGVGGVFDRAATTAVQQWRYSPVILNGRPERFVLTVTLSFTLPDRYGAR